MIVNRLTLASFGEPSLAGVGSIEREYSILPIRGHVTGRPYQPGYFDIRLDAPRDLNDWNPEVPGVTRLFRPYPVGATWFRIPPDEGDSEISIPVPVRGISASRGMVGRWPVVPDSTGAWCFVADERDVILAYCGIDQLHEDAHESGVSIGPWPDGNSTQSGEVEN